MRTNCVCPHCGGKSYMPVKTSYVERPNGVKEMCLEEIADNRSDLEMLSRMFPTGVDFKLEVSEREPGRVVLRTVFTHGAPNVREEKAPPPTTLAELRESAVMAGVIDAEKMSAEQIHQALAARKDRIGAGGRGKQGTLVPAGK